MTPNEYFDKIYVLNMKTETKRWDLIESLLKKQNISNYVRFDAINGYTDRNFNEWKQYSKIPFDDREKQLGRKKIGSPGVWGNLKSYKHNEYKSVPLTIHLMGNKVLGLTIDVGKTKGHFSSSNEMFGTLISGIGLDTSADDNSINKTMMHHDSAATNDTEEKESMTMMQH